MKVALHIVSINFQVNISTILTYAAVIFNCWSQLDVVWSQCIEATLSDYYTSHKKKLHDKCHNIFLNENVHFNVFVGLTHMPIFSLDNNSLALSFMPFLWAQSSSGKWNITKINNECVLHLRWSLQCIGASLMKSGGCGTFVECHSTPWGDPWTVLGHLLAAGAGDAPFHPKHALLVTNQVKLLAKAGYQRLLQGSQFSLESFYW